MSSRVIFALLLSAVACSKDQSDSQLDFSKYDIVDLTHAFNAQTIYWPNAPSGFKLEQLSHGKTEGGWFYSSNAFSSPEHGGTHLDAPIHFAELGQANDSIPLHHLMGPAVVIDIRKQADQNADYLLTRQDVLAFEKEHGEIPHGAIVLLHTGWNQRWPDKKQYMGDDTPGAVTNLHFPSFGEDAAKLLVSDRYVAAIGVDAASIDYGQSKDFRVHRLAAASNVPGLENLADMRGIPPTGATVIALPMKIEGGSGGPVRVVVLVPKR